MSFIKTQHAEEMETHTSVEEIIRNTFAINEENDSAMKLLSIGGMSKVRNIFFSPLIPSKREKNIQTETTHTCQNFKNIHRAIFVCLFVYFALIQSTSRLFKGQQYLNNMLRINK